LTENLTLDRSSRNLDIRRRNRGEAAVILAIMTKSDETNELSWPWWAPWALLAVALTSLLTVGAALYDIL